MVDPGGAPLPSAIKPVEALSAQADEVPADTAVDQFGSGVDFPASVDTLVPSGAKERVEANIAAVELVRALNDANRAATLGEQRVLACWSGWGAVPEVFDRRISRFEQEREHLRQLLSREEYRAAEASILNAHYTDPAIAAAVWEALALAGFSGGRVLEPGCGSGTFVGHAPKNAVMVGVENDPLTAAIAAHLYPSAQIRNEGFETTRVPEGSFVAAVGNVPFGRYVLADPAHNPERFSIHTHFIRKSLALTAPGGYVAVLTSRYTMDSAAPDARKAIDEVADLVGAVRLPTGAFSRVAGTDVVTDLLVLRKREIDDKRLTRHNPEWVQAEPTQLYNARTDDWEQIPVNAYFNSHPENVLGELRLGQGINGSTTLDVDGATGAGLVTALRARLAGIVQSARLRGLTLTAAAESVTDIDHARFDPGLIRPVAAGDLTPLYSLRYSTVERRIEFWDGHNWLPQPITASKVAETRVLIALRDTAASLITSQRDGRPAAERDQLRGHLNHLYDNYVARYGPINRFTWVRFAEPDQAKHDKTVAGLEAKWRKKEGEDGTPYRGPVPDALAEEWDQKGWETHEPYKKRGHLDGGIRHDPGWGLLSALELFNEATGAAVKSALFSTDLLVAPEQAQSAASPEEALAICMDRLQRVDVGVIASLLDVDEALAGELIEGLVYPDPDDPENLIPAPSALSGNVRIKLARAREAAAVDPATYGGYVAALEAVMPADRHAEDIKVRPGVPWIPEADVAQFVRETFGAKDVMAEHVLGRWAVEVPEYERWGRLMRVEWGLIDDGADAVTLFDAVCNSRSVVIYADKKTREVDTQATFAAQAKMEQIAKEFGRWVFADRSRRDRLVTEYNRRFNSLRAPKYDGTHLPLPGLSQQITPHPYQRDAIARIISEPTVLLEHCVGAGKSGVLISGALSLKRLGLVRQPWLVVPGHVLDQIGREAKTWYPAANILIGSAANDAEGRRRLVAQSAASDWDLVIVTQTTFTRIGVSDSVRQQYLNEQLDELRSQLESAQARESKKAIERAIKTASERLERLTNDAGKDHGLRFEQSGCDWVGIDEAHLYKNRQRVCNIPELSYSDASQRSEDLALKLEILRQRRRDEATARGIAPHKVIERVATFATGTPVANSLGELWVMQSYARPDVLRDAGVEFIGDWGANFTATHSTIEMNATGTKLRPVTRIGKYTNLPELLALSSVYSDVVTRDQVPVKLPTLRGGRRQVISLQPDIEVVDFITDLGWRAESLSGVDLRCDNILKIASDGQNVSLDPRLAHLGPPKHSRAAAVADEVMRIHDKHADRQYLDPVTGLPTELTGALQIVFCDLGTPSGKGKGFNVYQAIKDELIERGMPAHRVRFVHEARKPSELRHLFAQCNTGEVSVILGSTEKLGTGANIQSRLAALHHVDVPWRPADLEQREGRIDRQGNQNDEIEILTYVTEKTYDTVKWQKVEAKSLFIQQVRRNEVTGLEVEDLDGGDIGAAAAETKAIATGDPRYVRQVQLDDEVKRLSALERTHLANSMRRDQHVEWLQASNPLRERAISSLEQTLDTAEYADGRILVDGVEHPERADTAFAVAQVCANAFAAAKDSSIFDSKPTGIRIGGVNVLASRDHTNDLLLLSLELPSRVNDVPRDHLRSALLDDAAGAAAARGLVKRIENLHKDLPNQLAALRAATAREQSELQDLLAHAPGPFEGSAELADKRAELATLTLELQVAADSIEARERRAAAEKRMADRGREPGWSLLLNPTPAVLEKSGYRDADELRFAIAVKEAAAVKKARQRGSEQARGDVDDIGLG
ncbi:helicase-related protein [Mycobacteroides abscessus]|uniref:helicase-related protein n=1 Tax=Mycobacteroides abscessus TaxID=36809 RepID=UPI0009D33ABE|nr:helicase-related protein [Mycobacteroides abscessus]SKO15579.1 DNA methylase [Mycobacteroides abscessus subsp. bolletii]SKX37269.1 DNA methylase [Mycobacteroides abscessus subsp. bolletii]